MIGLPAYLLLRLQTVLDAAARLIFGLRRSDHIWDALIILHWLRIPERIKFNVAVLIYNILHGRAPSYLGPLTYLVAEICNPLAPAASFNHQYIVPPSAAEQFSGGWPSALEHFTVGGDVGAVAGDLPQASEDLLVHAVIPGHTPALTVLY